MLQKEFNPYSLQFLQECTALYAAVLVRLDELDVRPDTIRSDEFSPLQHTLHIDAYRRLRSARQTDIGLGTIEESSILCAWSETNAL